MSYGEKEPAGALTRRPRRRLPKAATLAFACAFALSATAACTIQESKYYVVQPGKLVIYAHIFRAPTKQILDVYESQGRDVNKTADILRQTVKISGWGAAEWNQALREDRKSLKESLETLRASRRAGRDQCLALRKDVFPPSAGNTDFLVSSKAEWCKAGVPFQGKP